MSHGSDMGERDQAGAGEGMEGGRRRLPVGAEVLPGAGGVHFRVWAPRRRSVDVVIDGGSSLPLCAEGNGYFAGTVTGAAVGTDYRFRLDGGDAAFPDPASRCQPD